MVRLAFVGPAFGFALLLTASSASAQNNRSFVSGQGSDSNSCALNAPCRTFQRAHDMTNAAGTHVNVHMVVVKLDSRHMASITRLTMDGISADDFAAAKSVLAHTGITAMPRASHHGRRHR